MLGVRGMTAQDFVAFLLKAKQGGGGGQIPAPGQAPPPQPPQQIGPPNTGMGYGYGTTNTNTAPQPAPAPIPDPGMLNPNQITVTTNPPPQLPTQPMLAQDSQQQLDTLYSQLSHELDRLKNVDTGRTKLQYKEPRFIQYRNVTEGQVQALRTMLDKLKQVDLNRVKKP